MNARCWASVADAERASAEGDDVERDQFDADVAEAMRKAYILSMQGGAEEVDYVVSPGGVQRVTSEPACLSLSMRFTSDKVHAAFSALMKTPEAAEFLALAAADYVAEHAEDVAEVMAVQR